MTRAIQLEAPLGDAVLHDVVALGAAAVLHHAEESTEPVAHPLAPHHHDAVRDRADVARGHLPGDEMLELGLLGGHQEQRGHRRVIVPMGVDEGPVLPDRQADLHAEGLAVAVDHLPVQVVEDVGWM